MTLLCDNDPAARMFSNAEVEPDEGSVVVDVAVATVAVVDVGVLTE